MQISLNGTFLSLIWFSRSYMQLNLNDFELFWMGLNDNSRTRIKEPQGSRPSNRVIPEKILFYTNSINWENLKKLKFFSENMVIFKNRKKPWKIRACCNLGCLHAENVIFIYQIFCDKSFPKIHPIFSNFQK